MKGKFFDRDEFMLANCTAIEDPYYTIAKFRKYLNKYPNDYSSYSYYIDLLLKIGEFNESAKTLSFLESIYRNDKEFIERYPQRVESIDAKILFCKIKLNGYLKNYKESYNLCMNNYDLLMKNKFHINRILIYCQKMQGIKPIQTNGDTSYLSKQIMRYNYDDFIKYNTNLIGYNEKNAKSNFGSFMDNFPFQRIINEASDYIPSTKKLYESIYEDYYYFKYDNCGMIDNKKTDYFYLSTLAETNDPLKIKPIPFGEKLPYVDLNYVKGEKTLKYKRR